MRSDGSHFTLQNSQLRSVARVPAQLSISRPSKLGCLKPLRAGSDVSANALSKWAFFLVASHRIVKIVSHSKQQATTRSPTLCFGLPWRSPLSPIRKSPRFRTFGAGFFAPGKQFRIAKLNSRNLSWCFGRQAGTCSNVTSAGSGFRGKRW
jgi:hypothetical protein